MAMSRDEAAAWATLRRYLAKVPYVYAERVENVVATGTPDVNLLGLARLTVQCELKAKDEPKRVSTPIIALGGYKPTQLNWHAAAARTSSATFVLVAHRLKPRGWRWYLFESARVKESYTLPRSDFSDFCIVVTESPEVLFDVWRKRLNEL